MHYKYYTVEAQNVTQWHASRCYNSFTSLFLFHFYTN